MTTPFSKSAITAMAVLMLAACTSDAVPKPPQQAAAKSAGPKDNPFAGTVYETQGDALDKARGVQDTIDQSAQKRLDDIDKIE